MVAWETSQINLVGDEIGVFFVAQRSGLPAVGFPEEMPGSFVELGMLIHPGWLSHPAQGLGDTTELLSSKPGWFFLYLIKSVNTKLKKKIKF